MVCFREPTPCVSRARRLGGGCGNCYDTLMDVEQVLEKALALHQAGDHTGAEALYREVLRQTPDDADALHLLGLMLAARGDRREEAERLLRRAAEFEPDVPE